MNPVFAFILEDFQERLKMSDGELMALAREVAHDGSLHTLAHLRRAECEELLQRLEDTEERQQQREDALQNG